MMRLIAHRSSLHPGDVESDEVENLLRGVEEYATAQWLNESDATPEQQRRTTLRCVGIRINGVTYHEQEIEAFEFDFEYDPRL